MTNPKSLLDELARFIPHENKHYVVENRANNVIASFINLVNLLDESYPEDESKKLQKYLMLSLKNKNPDKFIKKIREIMEDDDDK